MLLYIAWDGDHIGREVGRASLADDAEGLRRISQAIDQGNLIWKSWVESKGGNLISMGGDEGRAEVPADCIGELPAIREQYSGKVNAPVSVGVGMKLSEADKALVAAKLQGGDRIVFFTEEVDKLVAEAAERGRKTEEAKIADEYLNKAAPAMHPGAFAGAARPSPPTVQKPVATQGEHSEAHNLYDLLGDEDAPAPAEATHAAKDFERQLHEEAWKGEEDDMHAQAQQHSGIEQVKAQVVEALQALKAQAPVLEQVKSVAPGAYKAMMSLAQSVIGLAKQLSPAQPMRKSEGENDKTAKMVDAVRNAHRGEERGVVDLEHCKKGDCYEQCDALYHLLGGAESGFVPHHLFHGEFGPHWFLKDGKGRILDPMADTHHEPLPYDQGLPSNFLTDHPSEGAMEVIHKVLGYDQPVKKAETLAKNKSQVWWHGSPSGELRGSHNGLHVGTQKAAEDALHSRIGIPVEGGWDGTREYGKTMLAGKKTLAARGIPLTGYNAYAPEEDHLPTGWAKYGDGTPVLPEHKPDIFPVRIVGKMTNAPHAPHDDFRANGLMAGQVKRGTAKSGYYYRNVGEDEGSISAVVPPGGAHIERIKKEELKSEVEPDEKPPKGAELEKAKLPMPKAPAHHHVTLPVGSTNDQKVKVQHQDGSVSWKSVQAGQIRSMDPAGHPTSSRTPNSR